MNRAFTQAAVSLLLVLTTLPPVSAADLILYNGKIFIAPGSYTQAVAVTGARIEAVGENKNILALARPGTRRIDLAGRAVTPGFHDAHVHFSEGALSLSGVDLRGAGAPREVEDRLKRDAASRPDKEWVVARGWQPRGPIDEKRINRRTLDALIAGRPVAIAHVHEDILWVNTAALKILEGTVETGASGLLSGPAARRALRMIPDPPPPVLRVALEESVRLARSVGVTSVSGAYAEGELEFWTELQRQDRVTLRYWLWGRLDSPSDFLASKEKFAVLLPADRFHWSGLKGWIDGDIDSWSAALLEPYADKPESRGYMKHSRRELIDMVTQGHKVGLTVHLHAIGDRAVRAALDACAASLKRNPKKGASAPCVIEHADLVADRDLARFGALGIAASVQPSRRDERDDDSQYRRRLGPRTRRAFSVKSLQSAGAPLAFGSDWPVRPLDPLFALSAATASEDSISLEDAIVHHTLGPARAVAADHELGVIRAGYLADLVIFDRDLFTLSGRELLAARVAVTIFNGKIVYESN